VHDRLHLELQAIVADDPFVREALRGDDGDLIVAVRSSVVQDVVREAARLYLDQVVVDLGGLETNARGEIERKTLLGRMTVGRWRLEMAVERLEVRLRAGPPRLRVVAPNEVELQLPMEAIEAPGRVALRFAWDSASLANLVCRDFELSRELSGRTARQEHTIGGTFRLSARPGDVSVDPLAREDVIRLKVDLSPESWAVVEEALRSQDSLGKCGLLLDPPDVVRRLRALASEGFKVRLPQVMFRGMRLPGSFDHTARIDGRPITVAFRTRSFEATPRLMWSRAEVGIEATGQPRKADSAAAMASLVLGLPPH
jgi:hypothetical protein